MPRLSSDSCGGILALFVVAEHAYGANTLYGLAMLVVGTVASAASRDDTVTMPSVATVTGVCMCLLLRALFSYTLVIGTFALMLHTCNPLPPSPLATDNLVDALNQEDACLFLF
jgi:hypothetical protein